MCRYPDKCIIVSFSCFFFGARGYLQLNIVHAPGLTSFIPERLAVLAQSLGLLRLG